MTANMIKKHRERAGFTREKLATMIGKSYSSVVAYEQGIRDPDTGIWLMLAKIFDTSVDELTGFEKKTSCADRDLAETWPEVVQELRSCGKIPSLEERRRIARIIRASLED